MPEVFFGAGTSIPRPGPGLAASRSRGGCIREKIWLRGTHLSSTRQYLFNYSPWQGSVNSSRHRLWLVSRCQPSVINYLLLVATSHLSASIVSRVCGADWYTVAFSEQPMDSAAVVPRGLPRISPTRALNHWVLGTAKALACVGFGCGVGSCGVGALAEEFGGVRTDLSVGEVHA